MRAEYTKVLAKLAVRRQAEIDESTYTVYAEDLAAAHVELVDLQGACDELGKAPREAYQSAFPAVGDLLKACRAYRRARIDREIIEQYGDRKAFPAPAPLSPEDAKKWLDRIRYAGNFGLQALQDRENAHEVR